MGSRVGRRSKCGRDLWLFWEGCVPEGARTWGESPRGGMGPVVLFALESGTAVAQKFELSRLKVNALGDANEDYNSTILKLTLYFTKMGQKDMLTTLVACIN